MSNMVAMLVPIFLAFLSCTSFLSSTLADSSYNVSGGTDWWCQKTPYPDDCRSSLGDLDPNPSVPKQKPEFRKMALQAAMERALQAESHTKWLGQICRNDRERAAWVDCLKLYEDTILQLNRTLNPIANCTDSDTQTWLSTALTNLDTCKAGIVELGVSDVLLPLVSNNVSHLISNALAINDIPSEQQNYTGGFPTWVSAADRKLLQSSSLASRANLVVAQDGSGHFRTIKAAISAASKLRRGSRRFIIYVKAGVYRENIEIGNNMPNIMLIGDGMRRTLITGSRSVRKGYTTFNSATVAVSGERFVATGITFRNTAGPLSQAVALVSGSDLSVFYRCGFIGYQDTLYVHSQRQFYKQCYIYGTIDFIFGNAAVVLQNCMIVARRPLHGQANVITAQGRSDPHQNTGISIHKSRVIASSDLRPVLSSVKTFLGRPWQQYSRTVYLQTYLDGLVDPAGWLEWGGSFALNTLYYGEYKNIGPGSSTARRVKWRGYRVIRNPSEASLFTVGNFISGRSWLPGTGVPFTSGL
ncbi:PREDICTED: pectinesterase 2-like [Nelumbo nucifera]|uniref:Pectinesterase n=2 Tax=Nelumbo nucifera TaxID=4432 RepID=A0A822ZGD5_NELNU|nr:PREDICTED: pectinesterase 2-like [Nelumbo nucifera]DAD42106.1 TPA_asm: hypothetical protein HUJ06_000336 [Nelumbo nucifera]